MAQIVRMPDGQQVGFPDDMDQTRIRELILTKYPNAEREAAARTGAQPYQTPLEAVGTAIGNVPERVQQGVSGVAQASAEAYQEELLNTFDNDQPITVQDVRAGPFSRELISWGLQQVDPDVTYLQEPDRAAAYDARLNQIVDLINTPEGRSQFLRPLAEQAATGILRTTLTAEQLAAEQEPIDVPPGSWEQYAANAIGSTVEMAPALAASIALRNPIPALAWAGIQSGGAAYSEGRAEGLSPEEARAFSTLYAAAEAIPSAVPVGVLLQQGISIPARIAEGAAAEAIQEGFTEGLQFLIDKGFISPDATWEEALPRIRDASITGAMAGAMMGAGADIGVRTASAAGQAASNVSAEVFGSIRANTQRIIDGSFDAIAELGAKLQGLTLQERVDAFAEIERIRTEGTAQPTPAESAPETQTSTPDLNDIQPQASVIDRIISVESAGNPAAQNPNSSAGGLGQFTNGTWLQTVRQHAPEYAERSNAAVLAMKLDTSPEGIAFHKRMLEALTNDNRQGLVSAGITPTDGNLYLAHFLGLGGARKALSADPNASVRSVMGDAVVNANPFLKDMTVADMVNWAANKMGSAGASTIATRPGSATSVATAVGTSLPTGAGTETDTQTGAFPPGEEVTVDQTPQEEAPVDQTGPEPIPQENPPSPIEIITPSGERIAAVPEIVDLNDLTPASGSLQPRDRSRVASAQQIENIATELDPARLQSSVEADRGAPVIGPDGIVESGNGRVAAVRRAYEAYPERANAYRQSLRDAGYTIPDEGMPILVSRRTTPLTQQQRQSFVQSANTPSTARMSSTETAVADANLIDAQSLSLIDPGTNPTARGSSFAKAFLGKLPQSERAALIDKDGQLNSDGLRRVQNALMAAAYGDPATIARAVESTEDNARSITGALVDVAAEWAALKQMIANGEIDAVYDLSPHLTEALRVLSRARETAAQQSRPVKALINEAVNQTDMLGGAVSPEAEQFIRAFYNGDLSRAKSRENIGAFLRILISDIEIAAQPQLTGEAPQPREIIDAAKRQTDRTGEADTQRDIFAFGVDGRRSEKSGPQNRKPAVQRTGTRPARQDEGQSATRSEIDTQARTEAEPETWTDLAKRQDKLAYTPAKGHIQTFRERGMPQRPPDAIIPLTGGNIKLSDTPTRRDLPRKKLLAIIGDRLYQQRVKSRKMAGFYREKNSEVRVKRFDDIEIMAHEAAHFLDFDKSMKGIFTKLRKAGKGEINDLSYTTETGLVNIEGFAEYVRLWVTDYGQAKSAAPKFTKAFEKAINDAGIGRKMRAFQKASHRWYWQGELAQFRGKSGESSNFFDNFNAFMRSRPGSLFLQGFVDPHFAKKVIERETTGTVTDATRSAWKLGRMTAGSASMTEAVIRYGTPQIAEDGSYEFRGKSLEDVFMPVTKKKDGAERFDRLMEYFKARRASELSQQGRENLFTKKEIAAGLAYADQYPEFADVFDGWKTFNSEMLDFYVSMDLITPEQREAFEANNTEYVPFHRVLDKIGEKDAGAPKDIDKRLYGGEQNTREIAQNIVDGLSSNIHAALVSRAKSQLFRNIRSSQKGSEFAVKIGPGSKPLTVSLEAYKSRFAEILTSLGYPIEMNGQVFRPPGTPSQMAPVNVDDVQKLLDAHPELLQFWMHNQKPNTTETHVEPVIIEGELQWFEVNSPLLYRDLTAIRAATDAIRVLSFPKRMLTKAITSMPQFMGPNIVRDTLNAGALTQSKFRPFADSLKGMKSYIRSNERFKTFALNGGLFSGRIDADGNIVGDKARVKAKAQLQQLGVPPKNLFDQTGRALSSVSRFAVPFEMGTRLGQFERAVDNKVNPLEASFQGREISTDFAQMGRNETWRAFLQITPFANAGLQGIDQMTRHLLDSNGKVRPNLKSARKFGVQAFTRLGVTMSAATALLWLINNDDDRYKGLTVDQKARYWHVWLPTGDHIQIPKPYGVGFIFADLPEIALDYISKRIDDDPGNDAAAIEDAKRQLAFGLAQHFWFMDYPAILQPGIEAMQNKKFTGAPVVPQSLQDVEPAYQFTDRTPEIYRAMGRTLGISPLVAEHYMRGFFGYVESYMVDATDAFLWNEEAWGERPFSRGVLDYFTWQFNGQEIPYRTKWTEGYYELRQRTRTAAATYSHLFKQSPRSLDEFTEYTEREINLRLRELNTIFNRIDRAFSQGNAYLMSIKYNPDLSREVKEERMELWYKRRNDQLADSYERAEALIREFEEDQQP